MSQVVADLALTQKPAEQGRRLTLECKVDKVEDGQGKDVSDEGNIQMMAKYN